MEKPSQLLEKLLNALVLIGSIAIIVVVSIDMLNRETILGKRFSLQVHLTVCFIFLSDFFVRWHANGWTRHFFFRNLFFLVVSIPYLNIVHYLKPIESHVAWLILRFIPVVRGIYGVSLIVGWMSRNKITNLLVTYLTILLTTIYFSSILFFFLEHEVNPQVKNYWDAFDWALMNVTTVGSNIFGVTKIGQILAVVLASVGMIFFPIFTAYVTTRFQNHRPDS